MPIYRSAKLKMHRKFIIASVATLAVIGGVAGTYTVVPYVTSSANLSSQNGSTRVITDVGAGNIDLWDLSQTHSISLTVTQDNLDTMLSDYQERGEKTWVKATLTIDGVTVEDVGIRLKGNSTLHALSGNSNQGGPGGGMGPNQNTTDSATSETTEAAAQGDGTVTINLADNSTTSTETTSTEQSAEQGDTTQGQTQQQGGPGGGMGGGMSDYGIEIDDPSTWPILISFDKYYEGRVYQGMTRISIRPGIPSVNEYEAVKVTAASDQTTQSVGYSTVSINGGASTTRLIIQIPDEYYADSLGNGVLFKATADSDFSYQGDDQTSYTDQFDQINAEGDADLEPIIKFLKWLDSADDTEFDEHLADYVDVESFARYVATQNLIVNSDDMAGPGKNYYIWYDFDTKKISIISWDLNLSMQNSVNLDPTDSPSMGGGGGGGGAPGGNGDTNTDQAGQAMGQRPQGMGQPPQGMGQAPQDGGEGGGPGGGGGAMGGNTLKEKFLASEAFRETYLKAYWEVYDQIYGDDAATSIIDEVASQIPVSDNTSQETIDAAVEKVKTWVEQRKAYLESIRSTSDPALTGSTETTTETSSN